MFVSDLRGHDAPGGHSGVAKTRAGGGRGSYGSDSEAQFVADCQAIVLIRAALLTEIATAAATSSSLAGHSPVQIRVDQLDNKLQAYGRRIAASPATSDRALQCKRALVGLLLAQQEDDPVPLCDTLLLSLLTDVESMFAMSYTKSKSNGKAGLCKVKPLFDAGANCLAQIEEVFAECVRVGAMPSSPEQERLAAQVYTRLERTRGLVLDLAKTPAESALGVGIKGRVLRRLMTVGGADVHCQRLVLARSFVTDIVALGPPVDIEDGSLRIGGH